MASEEVAAGYVSLYARMDAASVADAIGGGISSSLGDIQGILGGISSFTQGLGTALTVAGAVAARGIGELAGSIVDAISVAENASITFETLGHTVMGLDDIGAAQFSNNFLDLLNQFAIKTPYEFAGLVTSARQLMAMGFTADEIVSSTNGVFSGILNSAGNAAAALGLTDQGFQNILLQIGHIRAAGKPMAYNINALARNGVNAWQMLADYMTNETGIETSIMDVRQAVREGKIDAETTIAALMEGFAQFDGQMERTSHTFSHVMSNIKDAMMVPIMDLRDAAGYRGMTDALYDFIDPLKELMYAIAPTVDEMMGRFGGGIEWLTGIIENLTVAINDTDPGRIADTLQTIGGVLLSGPFLVVFGKFVGLAGKLAGFGKKLTGAAFSGLASGLSMASRSMSGIAKNKNLLQVIGGIRTTVASGLSSVFGSFTNMIWPTMKSDLARVGADVGTTLMDGFHAFFGSKAGKTIEKFVDGFASIYSSTLGKAFPTAGKLAKGLVGIVGTELSTAAKLATRAFATFSKIMLTTGVGFGVVALGITAAIAGFTAFGGNLRDVGKGIQNTLRTASHVISSFIEDATKGMRKAIDDGSLISMFDSIAAGLTMFGNTVGAVLPDFLDAFKDVAKVVAERLVSGFATYAPVVARGAMTMFTGILTGLTYVVGQISSRLPTIVNGIANSIVDNAPALVSAAVTLVTTLANSLTQNLPIIVNAIGLIATTLAVELTRPENIEAMGTAAYNLFLAFLDALPQIVGILADVASTAVTNLCTYIEEHPEEVSQAFSDLMSHAGDSLGSIAESLGSLAGTVVGELCKAIVEHADEISVAIAKAIAMAIGSLLAGGFSFAEALWQTLSGDESYQLDATYDPSMLEAGMGGISSGSKALIDSRKLVPDSVSAEVQTRIGAVNNAASTAIDAMGIRGSERSFEAGKTIVYGFASGVGESSQVKTMATQTGNVPASTIKAIPTAPLTSAGKAIVTGFANGVKQSQPVKTAATNTGYVPSNTIRAIPTSTLTSSGVNMAKSFASGVGSSAAKSVASANASSLANSATKSMTSGKASAFLWGYELGSNFARGIKSAYSSVKSAAASLAKAAALPLKHSTPKEGPLSDDDMWGYHMAQNFEQGMLRGVALVERGSLALANAVSNPFDVGMQPLGTFGTYQPDGYPYAYPYGAGDVYNIYLDGDLLGVDGRIGRAVAQLVGAVEQTYEMGRS